MNTRRVFLASAAGPFLASGSVSPAVFRERLRGPICSAPTVYREDRSLDLESFRRIIETGVKAGCTAFTLTSGNNQYDRLSYEEIKQLTRTLVETVAGRGLTIAATGPWWTGQVVDYARFARTLGADAVQVQLPAQGDRESLLEHFRQAARASRCAIVLHGQAFVPLLRELVKIDEISAYKEEYPALYTREVFEEFGERINIFAGGQKGNFLTYWPYGMRAYYSTFSTFSPKVAKEFWNAVQTRDIAAAGRVVTRYDVPFFRGTPFGSWTHAYWRATLEAHGIAKRFLRQPEVSFDDSQVAAVRDFQKKLGLLEV
jgi:dihydrodipicolinate synthase/N-acetylneuraminate lyase